MVEVGELLFTEDYPRNWTRKIFLIGSFLTSQNVMSFPCHCDMAHLKYFRSLAKDCLDIFFKSKFRLPDRPNRYSNRLPTTHTNANSIASFYFHVSFYVLILYYQRHNHNERTRRSIYH